MVFYFIPSDNLTMKSVPKTRRSEKENKIGFWLLLKIIPVLSFFFIENMLLLYATIRLSSRLLTP